MTLFQPGNQLAGSRKGIPNKSTAAIKEIAEEYTPNAVKALVEIVDDTKAFSTARVKAAEVLLGYAYGKPSQSIDATITGGTAFLELLRLVSATEVGSEVVDIEAQSADIRDGSAAGGTGALANGSAEPDSDPGSGGD